MPRRTHCPAGRPLYRVGEIPDHLATVTMLRLQRRHPAPGQPAAASLLYAGNKYTELYDIAGTEQMPALSPGQQVAYAAARTCARCREQRETPWPRDALTGRRVCDPCGEAEAESSWRAERLAARQAAVAWAREVLADPAAVLIHCKGTGLLLFGAHAVELATGTVLLDAPRVWHNERDYPATSLWRPSTWDDTTVGIADIADQVRALGGRRLIAWSGNSSAHTLGWNMRTLLGEDLEQSLAVVRRPLRWAPDVTGDEVAPWYAGWIGQRHEPRAGGGRWRQYRDVRHQDLPFPAGNPDVAGEAAHMLVLLDRMAVDDHPAGPPACPALDPGGREICGSTELIEGRLCRRHLVNAVAAAR